jgi:hypothetical protein
MTSLKFIKKWLSRDAGAPRLLAAGNRVHVIRRARSPMPGELGVIVDICLDDPLGPLLVQFADGLQFRYHAQELEIVGTPVPEVEGESSATARGTV